MAVRLCFKDHGQAGGGPNGAAPSVTPLRADRPANEGAPPPWGKGLVPWTGLDGLTAALAGDPLEATPPSLALLRDGFDGRALASPDDQACRLWRMGRWLATQTTRRPGSLQIIDDWTVVIDRRVVQSDAAGNIHELSSRPKDQGTRLASLACWGRRR